MLLLLLAAELTQNPADGLTVQHVIQICRDRDIVAYTNTAVNLYPPASSIV